MRIKRSDRQTKLTALLFRLLNKADITVKTKLSIAALAVASTFTGAAHAATNADSISVLRALMAIDTPNVYWVNDHVWTGVESYTTTLSNVQSNRTSFAGNPWVAGDEALACDTWAGVLCVDGDITYLEIPFAEVNGDMSRLMSALEPVKSTLRSLNVVGNGNLHGSADGLEQLTELEGLYLDNTGLSGVLPDLSGMSNLRFAGLNDNYGLTGLAGGIGGASLEVLNLNNTPNFTADMTSVLETSKNSLVRLNLANSAATGQIPDYSNNTNLNYFVITGSGLGGQLNLPSSGQISPENIDTSGTGVSAGSGAEGLGINPSIAAVSSVNAAANGANAMLVSWNTVAEADGYIVSYSSDAGANWSSETIAGGSVASSNITSLAAGTYLVSVTAYIDSDGKVVQSSPTQAPNSVVISDSESPVSPSAGNDDDDTGSKKKSGGAALWLGLLPLMALARRRKS